MRPVGVTDAAAVGALYGTEREAEMASRLARTGPAGATAYYALETGGEIAAVFALTALGRLRPGTAHRVLLHEFKLGARFRGTGAVDQVLTWLRSPAGVGPETEVLALAPPGRLPEAFARHGLVSSLQAFSWEAAC